MFLFVYLFFSIGIVHRKNDEIERAHKCLSSALKIKMHYYFKDHASIAETLVELAKTESKKGNFHEAINKYELALSIYQKSLGAHKSTVQILDSIGSLFLVTEQYDKAYRHLERALAMKRLLYGNDDEELSDTLHLIGKVQGKSGDIDDALDSLKEGKNYNFRCVLNVHLAQYFLSLPKRYVYGRSFMMMKAYQLL